MSAATATLLLDQSYQALGTISWQRAVTLLSLGKVEVVEEYNNRILRSRTWVLKMPAVVRLISAFRRNKKEGVKFSRQNILARDGWKCQYCGVSLDTKTVTYDHVIPKSKGGKTCWENIVSSCAECNGKKSNLLLSETDMALGKKPKKPTWLPIIVHTKGDQVPKEWKSYLYWNTELES